VKIRLYSETHGINPFCCLLFLRACLAQSTAAFVRFTPRVRRRRGHLRFLPMSSRLSAQLLADFFSQFQQGCSVASIQRSRESRLRQGNLDSSNWPVSRRGPLRCESLSQISVIVLAFFWEGALVTFRSSIPFPCGLRGIDLRSPSVRVVIFAGRRRALGAQVMCASHSACRRFGQLAPSFSCASHVFA